MPDIHALLSKSLPTPVHPIREQLFHAAGVQLFLKRDDLIHPEIAGNKWRKLKYHLLEAQRMHLNTVLTFGGAYSNHIAATAAACRIAGMKSIGIIRGEELSPAANPTLRMAAANGMRLEFISREKYRNKEDAEFIKTFHHEYGDFFLIPEGGAGNLGMKGCAEILDEVPEQYDFICVACGTGTTLAGILLACKPGQKVLGFPALQNQAFSDKAVRDFLNTTMIAFPDSCKLVNEYHFGGYAQHTPELIQFIREFKLKHHIELDFIYTGKMLFGIYDMLKKGCFAQGAKILAIHTGGVQGNKGIGELKESA